MVSLILLKERSPNRSDTRCRTRPPRKWSRLIDLAVNIPDRILNSLDNVTDRDYYETQNYLDSRLTPDAPIVGRIHGTPG